MHRGGGSTAAAASSLPLLGISGGFGWRRNGNGGGSGSGCGGGRGGPSSSTSSSGEFDPGPAGVTFGPEIRLQHSNVSACGSGETVAPASPGSVPTKGWSVDGGSVGPSLSLLLNRMVLFFEASSPS